MRLGLWSSLWLGLRSRLWLHLGLGPRRLGLRLGPRWLGLRRWLRGRGCQSSNCGRPTCLRRLALRHQVQCVLTALLRIGEVAQRACEARKQAVWDRPGGT